MKKTILVLGLILSLVILSCENPDNIPSEERSIEFLLSLEVFPEKIRNDIKKIEFSYEIVPSYKSLSKPIVVDVPEKGDVNLGKFPLKKGTEIEYIVKALDKDSRVLDEKSGTIIPKKGLDKIYIEPEKTEENEPGIVVKVLNSNLPEGTTQIYVDAFGPKDEIFNPTLTVDVAAGDYTEIPINDDFLKIFLSVESVEFSIASLDDDAKDPIVARISYLPGKNEYVVEKPRELEFKVKNQNLPEGTERFYAAFYYGERTVYRLPFDVTQDSEFTILDRTTDLSKNFMEKGRLEVEITKSIGDDPVEGVGFHTIITYSPSIDSYTISNTGYIPPSEIGKRDIVIKPGTYLENVSYYNFRLNPDSAEPRYWKVDASESGNTILVSHQVFEAGTEYSIQAMYDGYGGPYILAEDRGTLAIPGDDSDIVLEPMVPNGRVRLDFDAPFWAFKCGYKINGASDSQTWDAIGPKYEYLPAGEYELTDIYCTSAGFSQSLKQIELNETKPFTIESGTETEFSIVIGETEERRDVQFYLEGATDYTVTINFSSPNDGFESFEYEVITGTFILENVPNNTNRIDVVAKMGTSSPTKSFEGPDLENNIISWNFTTNSK